MPALIRSEFSDSVYYDITFNQNGSNQLWHTLQCCFDVSVLIILLICKLKQLIFNNISLNENNYATEI